MEYRFNASEWVNLSPGERIKRCRILAYEASALGRAAASTEMKRMYLQLAEDWQGLAQEIERETPTQSSPTERRAQ
jgi:hypothetical protein